MSVVDSFKKLIVQLNSENRMFHMDDDINDLSIFTAEEKVEFGAIIAAARSELSDEEFDDIAYD